MTHPMTAQTLAHKAREANGDCYYENMHVYVQTGDGRLHAATGFAWDETRQVFVLTSVPGEPPLPEPANNTDWIDDSGVVFSRRDDWLASTLDRHWHSTESGQDSWHGVCRDAKGKLRQVGVDPMAGVPEWVNGAKSIHIGVEPFDGAGHRILVGSCYADLSETEWESLAATMLRRVQTDRTARTPDALWPTQR